MTIEITSACNVSCVHCYIPSANPKTELSTAEVQRILDEMADAGVIWLTITGGEPFLRKDFEEIYLYAKRKGFIITLFSNGILINERVADMLAEWPPFAIEITVHSMNEEIFDEIAKVKGSYKRCMNAIKLLKERGISLRLKTIAMKQNKDDISGVQQFADEIGAEFRFDPQIQPKLDKDREPLNVRLSAQEIVDLDIKHGRIIDDWKYLNDRYGSAEPGDPSQVYTCGAGISGAYINPQGKLSACLSTQYESYDLRTGSFEEGWSEFLPKVISKKARTENKCATCQLSILCGRCVGLSYLEGHDEEAVVDFLCEVGLLRKRAIEEYALVESE